MQRSRSAATGSDRDRSIDPHTSMGAVRLKVANLHRMRDFYEQAIGLDRVGQSDGVAALGAGGRPLVELVHEPGATPRPGGTTGLFHLAILVPDRPELARAIRRVLASGWQFDGAADHLVSEAMYLSDPEGNGIEIYRDRPREQWRRIGDRLEMATLPLDLDGVLGELPSGEIPPLMPTTRMGHVHLQVADLVEAEAFYVDVLGFEVTVRGYPGALFVSAGGYHHHLGLNTWAGPGAPAPPPGSRGLAHFDVVVPTQDEITAIAERAEAAGVAFERDDDGLWLSDASGNKVHLISG